MNDEILVEFGNVSEETQGPPWGVFWEGWPPVVPFDPFYDPVS